MRVVFVVEPSLPLGLLANTVATLAIGLGAAAPTLGGVRLRDRTGRAVLCSADRPAPILQAPADRIRELLLKALPPPLDGIVVPFPAFARAIHQFEDYVMSLERRDLVDEAVDGLALAGPERWVRSLTGSLKLLR
jgi:hypothetical protein